MKRIIKIKKNGQTHVHLFDLEETYKMPEFSKFAMLKESKHKFSDSVLKLKFGEDSYFHLNLAYEMLKEIDTVNEDNK